MKQSIIHGFLDIYFDNSFQCYKDKRVFFGKETTNYYVNGERLGSTKSDDNHNKFSVDKTLYDRIRNIFGTSPVETREIVESWFLNRKSFWSK